MLTVEKLKNLGVNAEEGLTRCMNNETFYLKLVGMALNEPNFERLQNAVAEGNVKEAFESAHALKGVIGNLSLTPIYNPLNEMTEELRGKNEMPDVRGLLSQVMEELEKIRSLTE